MIKIINKIIEIFSKPLAQLNTIAWITGSIWMLFLGEWRFVFICIGYILSIQWTLILLLFLTVPLNKLADHLYFKYKILSNIVNYFTVLYTNLLALAACISAFILCVSKYDGEFGLGLVPYLLLSWAVAIIPWRLILKFGGENDRILVISTSISLLHLLFFITNFLGTVANFTVMVIIILTLLFFIPYYFLKNDETFELIEL